MTGKFNGRTYSLNSFEGANAKLVQTALRRGILDHLGSLVGSFPGMSQPQVYYHDGMLIAGACTLESQHIDAVFFMSLT